MSEKAPDWALEPFEKFLDYLRDSDKLLHFSMDGISRLRHLPQAVAAYRNSVDVLASVKEEEPRGDDKEEEPHGDLMSAEKAEELAAFAKAEVERDFPLLHAHTLIGVWSAFEATMENVVVAFLINEPHLLRDETFSKIRVRLSDFELLEKEERMRLLVEEFEKQRGLGRRHGVDRFEGLLEPIGLSASVDPAVKRDFLEMHHFRNVLIHRGGEADRRIIEGCPWLNVKLGEHLTVGSDALGRYQEAIASYTLEMICRISARFGRDVRGKLTKKDNC